MKIKILKIAYGVTITLLLATLACTPFLVKNNPFFSEKFIVEEDVVESFLIVILLSTAYLVSKLYQLELKRNQQEMNRLTRRNSDLSNRLNDAFHYIGGVNAQIQQIRYILSGLERYPVSKHDLKNVFDLYAWEILGIANTDWVVIRIINRTTFRTITEHVKYREAAHASYKHISNKSIISGRNMDGYLIVTSRQENLSIKGVCIIPNIPLDHGIRMMVEAIVNQIEMLHIIFTSKRHEEIYLNSN